jgi:hypothetical protein
MPRDQSVELKLRLLVTLFNIDFPHCGSAIIERLKPTTACAALKT